MDISERQAKGRATCADCFLTGEGFGARIQPAKSTAGIRKRDQEFCPMAELYFLFCRPALALTIDNVGKAAKIIRLVF
jgi:hypothetical protein